MHLLDAPNFYLGLAVATGLGALIGLEREHHRDKVVIAGVRTFPLFAVSGYLLGLVTRATESPWILAAGVVAMGAIAIAFMVLRHQLGSTGLTTPAAMLVTFVVGALVSFGLVQEAVVVGVGVTFLLLTKERLHRFAHVMGDQEMLSTLQFIAILFILFPLALQVERIPGVPFVGRGELIDPPKLLVIVLFVSGISFVSFLVMRQVGPRRGLEFSGLLGGLVNSEATSTSLATHAAANRTLLRAAAAGILFATATMFVRNLVIAGFVDPSFRIMRIMLVPSALMAAVAVVYGLRERERTPSRGAERVHVKNPFAVGPAVKFASLFAGLSVFSALAQRYFGEIGIYAVALGGFASAGAATASVAALYASGKAGLLPTATTAVLAMLIGALNKIVVLRAVGPHVLGRVRIPILATVAAGVVGLVLALALLAAGLI